MWVRTTSVFGFLDHTRLHITVGRTPLDEGLIHHRDLYMKTHNTHKKQTTISTAGFEPAVPANEWLQTLALDHSVTGSAVT
jgi:hypothetical protein